MTPPINFGGDTVDAITIDGDSVKQVTVDGSTVFSTLPILGFDHFYWAPQIDDVSADWQDSDGPENATPINTPSLGDINGEQSVLYDSTNSEYHETANPLGVGTNQEYTIAVVFELTDDGNIQYLFSDGKQGTDGYYMNVSFGQSTYRIGHYGIGLASGGTPDEGAHVVVATYDGATVIADLDGVEIINSSLTAPNDPTAQANIASRSDAASTANGDIGAVGQEASFADSARRDEITDALAEAFGITTST